MDDIVIDTLFAMVFPMPLVLVLILLPYAGISLRRFSLPSFFLIFYVVFSYVGILVLFFGWDEYRQVMGMVDKKIILELFIYSSSSLIMITFGYMYARQVIGLNAVRPGSGVLVSSSKMQRMFIFFLFLLCVFVLKNTEIRRKLYTFVA